MLEKNKLKIYTQYGMYGFNDDNDHYDGRNVYFPCT